MGMTTTQNPSPRNYIQDFDAIAAVIRPWVIAKLDEIEARLAVTAK